MTTDESQARKWATEKFENPAVVKFTIKRSELDAFRGKVFSDSHDPELWKLTRDNRMLGGRKHDFDWVEGPYLANPPKAVSGRESPKFRGHQLSIHSKKIGDLLGKAEDA